MSMRKLREGGPRHIHGCGDRWGRFVNMNGGYMPMKNIYIYLDIIYIYITAPKDHGIQV